MVFLPDNSDSLLAKAGARVVSSSSVPHPTNAIDVAPLLVSAIRELEPNPTRQW